ncbi:MAG: low specificity L-threonine aldolase [Nocardioidaceae bacterium]|nr:low specificity L-threonine aldolase [Nocardioidaceae bacterium]MCL2612173.1 low specificity L-threonine aldolase [Nocardioidaceae bacterium]
MIQTRHDPARIGFASDNYGGAHPAVIEALAVANNGHVSAYGADPYSEALPALFGELFGDGIEVYPVWNGTGANVVSLMALTERWDAVVCTTDAHINTDECGAPERVGGLKLLAIPTEHAKLRPEQLAIPMREFEDEHRARPSVLSLTQSTELGTVYTPSEVAALAAIAHGYGMSVHMDGARIANAAAALGVPVREFTRDAGVDVLSFGGTKNGLVFGEAVVVLSPERVRGMPYLRKLSMQLSSKMRFVSAQLEALLHDDLWLRSAGHSNAMARRLAAAVEALPGFEITSPVHANAVFVRLPRVVAERVQPDFPFYLWDETDHEHPVARWMCSFDHTEAHVDAFVAALAAANA